MIIPGETFRFGVSYRISYFHRLAGVFQAKPSSCKNFFICQWMEISKAIAIFNFLAIDNYWSVCSLAFIDCSRRKITGVKAEKPSYPGILKLKVAGSFYLEGDRLTTFFFTPPNIQLSAYQRNGSRYWWVLLLISVRLLSRRYNTSFRGW